MRSRVAPCAASLFLAALPLGMPLAAPAADTAQPAAGRTSAQPQATFDISEFRVLGNHLLPPVVVERAVYPYLGPQRTLDTVRQAAAALEKAYKDSGYGTVFVDVPPQQVEDGIVRLKVTEGKLERVQVRGARYFSDQQILSALPALQPGQTPLLPSLQNELGVVNARSADRAVTPILKAGSQPGTVDVDLAVKDTLPLHGSLQYDDRHTAYTTPDRLTAALSYDNLWQRQDSLGVEYQTAPARVSDAEVFVANYTTHFGPGAGLGNFSYIQTRSSVLAVGTLGVLGTGSIYGAHWIEPLVNTATNSQNVNVGADYKDVLTRVLPNEPGATLAGAVSARVKYLNWSAVYSGSWSHGPRSWSLSGGVGFGIRGAFNSVDEFENTRYNAYTDYFYVRGNFTASQLLPLGVAFAERGSVQWSDSPLVNNEQFSLGGVDTVRGYLEAETLGDSGISGGLELHSPALGARLGSFLRPLYAFGFVDAGEAKLVDPLPSQQASLALWSTGAGLRLEDVHGLTATADWAVPQKDGVTTHKGESRVEFLVRYGF